MTDKYSNIPESLKKLNQWVCYKLVYNEKRSKYDKIPKNPHNGYNAKSNDTATWSDYETAVKAVKLYNFNGIGIELENGIFGVDLDNVIDKNGSLTEEAKDIIKILDSYTEYSPSKKGLHIICKGEIPGKGKRKCNIEMYSSGRFFTVTGDILGSNKDIEQRSQQAQIIYDKYFNDDKQELSAIKSDFSDSEIIDKASSAKNGDLFKKLWNGNAQGYNSLSEADQALCNILAFYCGDDFNRIDSLFRKSGLYREKWNRLDYKSKTINKAISDCKNTFSGYEKQLLNKSSNGYVPYYINQKTNPKTGEIKFTVNCPLLSKYIRENNDYLFVTDEANGAVMRYWYRDGYYRLFNDDMIKGVIKGYITSFNEEILKMSDVSEVFNDLTTDLKTISQDKLNTDENIINFQNGILDLKTMSLLPHSPTYYSTIQIPCNWTGIEEETPVFDNFIKTFTNNDKEIEKLIMQFMGVCLSNIKGYRMKKSLFMVGAGDTGKSQLKALTEKLLGKENYTGIGLKELESRFGTSNIYNKRLSGSSDMSFLSIEELKTFKKCTGGDALFAEFKGKNGFNFTYNGLLWFCMNRRPKFGGDNGEWVYNRIMQIDCKNVIPPEKQDKFLLDKMYKERNGIVYKSIMALNEVILNGYEFTIPESVRFAKEDYKAENSTVISFYNECMIKRPTGSVSDDCTTQKVYEVYREWCKDNNHGYAKTAKEFREELSEILGKPYKDIKVRIHGVSYYKDFTLSLEAKRNYVKVYGFDSIDRK